MIHTFEPFGYEGCVTNVEVGLRSGIPAVDVVGIADSSVSEFRETLRAVFKNQNIPFPSERVLISLSPVDIRKDGYRHVFGAALATIIEKDKLTKAWEKSVMVVGELELSGKVRTPMNATYAALASAQAQGICYAIAPVGTVCPKGMKMFTVDSLAEAYDVLKTLNTEEDKVEENKEEITFTVPEGEFTLDEIKDTPELNAMKFAMTVAAAGRHNILAIGNPGCGKSMLLTRLPELTPDLLENERNSVTRIHSIAGLLKGFDGMMTKRPFRMPHQTASVEGMCGGGVNCRPGEVSLAHKGTIFLDEAAEFRSSVLQMLRVPVENKTITLSRAGRSTTFPADFQLAMATNPCPCGNYGSHDRICLCSAKSIELYWRKFSAPLLDRIDIRFNFSKAVGNAAHYTLSELQNMVKTAWEAQLRRQGKLNCDLTGDEIMKYAPLDDECQNLLDSEILKHGYSARAIKSIRRVARTIADMYGVSDINRRYLQTAIDLRNAGMDEYILNS